MGTQPCRKRLISDCSIGSSEHLMTSETHLRKSTLIVREHAGPTTCIIHAFRNILLTSVKDTWTGIRFAKNGQLQPPNWTYAKCSRGFQLSHRTHPWEWYACAEEPGDTDDAFLPLIPPPHPDVVLVIIAHSSVCCINRHLLVPWKTFPISVRALKCSILCS